ncbi:hypothetical protein [Bacterioplanoides sp.]|uniref:hypothetical protein n=1 Tax=Bacterioplanoides sp. TaxID=2066072 RepID=UPI003AFFE174
MKAVILFGLSLCLVYLSHIGFAERMTAAGERHVSESQQQHQHQQKKTKRDWRDNWLGP